MEPNRIALLRCDSEQKKGNLNWAGSGYELNNVILSETGERRTEVLIDSDGHGTRRNETRCLLGLDCFEEAEPHRK